MSNISIDHNKVCRENTHILIWVAISSLGGISIITSLVVFFSQPADILTANVRLVIANRNFTENMLDLSSSAWKSIEKPFCAEMDLYYQHSNMRSYYRRCKLRSLRSSADPKGLAVHITLDFQRTIITKNLHRIKEIIMLKSGRHISHSKLYLVIRNFWVYLRSINVDVKILPVPENPFVSDHSTSASSSTDVSVLLYTQDGSAIQSPDLTNNKTYVKHNMSINASLYLSRADVKQTAALLTGVTNKQSIQTINNITPDVSRVAMLIQTSFPNIVPSARNGMLDVSHYDNMHSKDGMQGVSHYDNMHSKDGMQGVSHYDNMHSKDGMQGVSHYDNMHSKDGMQGVSHYDKMHSKDGMQGVSHYDNMHSKDGMQGVSHYDNMHSKDGMQGVSHYDNMHSKDGMQGVSHYDNMHSKDGMQGVSHYDNMHSKDGMHGVSHYDNMHSKDGLQGVSHYDSMHYIASGEVLLIAPAQAHINEYFIPRTLTTEPIRNSSMIVPILASLMGESTISPTTVDNTMSSSRLGPKLLQSPSKGVVSTQNHHVANSSITFSSKSYETPYTRDAHIFDSSYYKNDTLWSSATFTDRNSTIPWDFETVYSSFNKKNSSTALIPLYHVPKTINTKRSLEKQSPLLYTTKMPVLYEESKQPLHENIVNYQPLQEVLEIKVNPSSTSSFLLSVNSTNSSSQNILVSSTIVKRAFSDELLFPVNIQSVIARTKISSPSTIAIVQSRDVTDGMKVLRKEPIPNIQERVDFEPNIDLEKVPSNNIFLPSQQKLKVSDSNKIQREEVNGISNLSFTAPIRNEFTLSHVDGLGKMGIPIPTQSMPNSVVMQIPSKDSRSAIFDTFPYLKSFEDIWETPVTLLSAARNTGALLPSIDTFERTEMIVNSGIHINVSGITSHTMQAFNGPTNTSTSTPGFREIETAQIIVNSTKGNFENANNHGELGSQLSAQSGKNSAPSPYEMTLRAFLVQSDANDRTLGPFAGHRDIIRIGEMHATNIGITDVVTSSSDVIKSSNFQSIHPFVSELNVSNTVVNSLQIDAQIDMANEFPIGSTGSQLKTLDKRKLVPNEHVHLQSENYRNQETNIRDIISGFETNKATNPVSTNFQDAIMNAESNTRDLLSNIDAVKGNEMTVNSDINTTVAGIINHAMEAYNALTSTSTLVHRRGVIETKQSIVSSAKDFVDNVNAHGKLDPQLETQLGDIDAPNHFEMTSSAFDVQRSRNNGALHGYKDITYTGDILHTQSGIVIADTSFSNVMPSSNFNLTQQVLSRVDVRKPALSKVRIDTRSFVTKALPIRSRKVELGKLENLSLVPIIQSPFQSGGKRPAETAIHGFVSGHKKNKVTNPISRNSQNAFMDSSELQNIITTGTDSRLRHEPIHSFQAAVDEAGEANIDYIREQPQHNVGDNRNRNINNVRGIGHKHLSLVERVSRNEVTNSLPQHSISKLRNMNLSNFLRSYCPNALVYQTYVHPMSSKIRPFLTDNGRAFPQLFKFPMAQPTRTHRYQYPKHKYLRQQSWSKTANINHLTYINTFSYGSVTGGTGRYLLNSLWNKFVKVNGHVHILPNRINNDYTKYWYGDYIRTTSTLQSIFKMCQYAGKIIYTSKL